MTIGPDPVVRFTLKVASARCGLSVRELQRLCKQGRIPGAEIIGRMWFVPEWFTIIPGKRGPKLRTVHPA